MPIILDLCGGTGSWSRPYEQAGYDVRVIDPLVDPILDVRTYVPPQDVHGILAAPPCTEFSIAGARWWATKDPRLLPDALSIVAGCLRVIAMAEPVWWAMENPVGRITMALGKPRWKFQPYEFGDPWQKKTCIWGVHTIPVKMPLPWPPNGEHGMERWTLGPNIFSPTPTRAQIEKAVGWGLVPPDWEQRWGPHPSRALLRSITPPKFAQAFFEANP